MADDADLSEQETEFLLDVARRAAALKAAKRLPPKGSCYNCEEPLEKEGQLFCDADCEQDYRLRTRREAMTTG